ncbi:Sec-independent protein translocase subunit TatA/TatB [Adlercreutzia faecimuris]|uniref:Sec-independent protein translocase protein TatA n=1 Tax=Adlercreutzia faecimuris TaxID=2897341 RepID=A0ABS9WEU2_9ACTN|nr:twin-arginine translocase TatA/TatE family subunit [Adlercreutzia sp. JBNU-10]
MFGIGGFELFLILLFGFLIFGPDKLPAMAKTLGKAIAKFRSAQEEMTGVLKGEVFDKDADEPFKNPLDALDNAAAKAEKAAGQAKKAAVQAHEKAESFSARKARYDRERAAKKAAEGAGAGEAAGSEAEAPVVTGAAVAAAAAAAGASGVAPAAATATESFSERRARYERERAARQADEAKPVTEAADAPADPKPEAPDADAPDDQKGGE